MSNSVARSKMLTIEAHATSVVPTAVTVCMCFRKQLLNSS